MSACATQRTLTESSPVGNLFLPVPDTDFRDFLDEVFGHLDLDWHDYVKIDPQLFRPAEVDVLCGDAGKARRVLHWEPKVTFRDLARMMTDHDLKLARREMTNV